MSFPRYPSYKDSGVEWLGEVPEHWEVKLVKNLASIVNGYPFDSALFDASEGFPLVRIRDLNKSEAETFYKGEFVETAAITSDDVLIGMDGDFNVGRWRGQGRALLNQRMCCVRGKSNVLTRLLEYSLPLRLKAINDVTYATTVKHLASSQVEKSFVAIPPDTVEQTQIAAFLDRETAKIDALVAEQRRLMELLKEKRQAVISHAVTQGLNPHAPMKPSGIEWLGDVPTHWRVGSARWLTRRYSGGTPDKTNLAYWEEGTIPWLNSGAVNDRLIIEPSTYITTEAFENSSAKWIPEGSLVMALAGQGKTKGMVAQLAIPSTCNQSMAAIIPGPEITARFLFWWLESNYQNIRNMAGGDLRDGLNLELLGSIPCPLAPLPEQTQIAAFLDTETAKFDTLTAEAQRAIDLLQERRTALISAAVTGQIKVIDIQ